VAKNPRPFNLSLLLIVSGVIGLLLLSVWPIAGIVLFCVSLVAFVLTRVRRPSQTTPLSWKLSVKESIILFAYALSFPLASHFHNEPATLISLFVVLPFIPLAYIFGALGHSLLQSSLGYLPGFAVAVLLQAYVLYVLYRAARYRKVPSIKPLEPTR